MYTVLINILVVLAVTVGFHQNDYHINFERVEFVDYNKKYINYAKVTTFKYNRTQPAVNGTLDVSVALGNDVEMVVEAYKFASNEYRLFPLRFGFNFCEYLMNDEYGLKSILQHGNVTECPIKKGRYVLSNWVPDQRRFPPHIPNGSYKIVVEAFFFSDKIGTLDFFCTISRPLGRRH